MSGVRHCRFRTPVCLPRSTWTMPTCGAQPILLQSVSRRGLNVLIFPFLGPSHPFSKPRPPLPPLTAAAEAPAAAAAPGTPEATASFRGAARCWTQRWARCPARPRPGAAAPPAGAAARPWRVRAGAAPPRGFRAEALPAGAGEPGPGSAAPAGHAGKGGSGAAAAPGRWLGRRAVPAETLRLGARQPSGRGRPAVWPGSSQRVPGLQRSPNVPHSRPLRWRRFKIFFWVPFPRASQSPVLCT